MPARAPGQLQTLASVAQRIYAEESRGTVDQAPGRALQRDSALVGAAARGDAAAAQAAAARDMGVATHITGIRVVRNGRQLANVSGSFVVGATPHPLGGASGTQVVVRGSSGHAFASLPVLTRAHARAAAALRPGPRGGRSLRGGLVP